MGNVSPSRFWLLDLGLRGEPEEAWRCTGDIQVAARVKFIRVLQWPLPSSQCLCGNLVKSSNDQTGPAGQVLNSQKWKRFETQCSTLRTCFFLNYFCLSKTYLTIGKFPPARSKFIMFFCTVVSFLTLLHECLFSQFGLCVISSLSPISALYHCWGIFIGTPCFHPTSFHMSFLDLEFRV